MNINMNVQMTCMAYFTSGISEKDAVEHFTKTINSTYCDMNNEITKNMFLQALMKAAAPPIEAPVIVQEPVVYRTPRGPPHVYSAPQAMPEAMPQAMSQPVIAHVVMPPVEPLDHAPMTNVSDSYAKRKYDNYDDTYSVKKYNRVKKDELWVKLPEIIVNSNRSASDIHLLISNLIKSKFNIRRFKLYVPSYYNPRHCYIYMDSEEDAHEVKINLNGFSWEGGILIVDYNRNPRTF